MMLWTVFVTLKVCGEIISKAASEIGTRRSYADPVGFSAGAVSAIDNHLTDFPPERPIVRPPDL